MFSIDQRAREFDVITRTIRFYEDKGLLPPSPREQARMFAQCDTMRLTLILRGKRFGFSLAEINEIFDMYDAPPGEAGQLKLLIEKIGAGRARLMQHGPI